MKRVCLILCILLIGSLWTNALHAALYRWTDAGGQLHYSTTPPVHPVERLEIKQHGIWTPYAESKQEPSTTRYTQKSPQQKATVNYRKQKSSIIIEATINKKLTEAFLIDTGATYTIISPDVAKALNLEPNPKVPPITLQAASGMIEAPLINLDVVTVGELEVPNIEAAIYDIAPDSGISGVIGLNFLNRFTMTVDSTHHTLTLERSRSLAEYANRDCAAAREWLNRGQALNDQSDEEILCYKKAISLCDDLVEAYYYLGDVYYRREDYQRAIEEYLKIVRMLPDEPEAHYRLGVLYALAGRFFQAKQAFQKTLELAPDHQEAKEALERLQW